MLTPPVSATMATGVLYLHGFNSGTDSPKAVWMREACRRLGLPCESPQLPHRPLKAMALAEQLLEGLGESPLVVGSSMGGFLATCLSERFGLSAALINPAVAPERLVGDWIGTDFINDYTLERFTVTAAHQEDLVGLSLGSVTPSSYLLLLGTADETLPPQEAFAFYRGARTILHPGGDHGFSQLRHYLPAILAHGGHVLMPGTTDGDDECP
jgi:predicted esterase YcpF (UPF0227 family)